MIYVSYDSSVAYPQDALFGVGVQTAEGHTPPAGLSSFAVDDIDLVHGIDERFYQVDAADSLSPLDQATVDAFNLEDYKEVSYLQVDGQASIRQEAAEANPSIGVNLDENGRVRNNNRRNNKAKKKINTITDADDHLFDHIDLIYDAADLIRDDIEAALDIPMVDAILDVMPVDARWPVWVAE